MHEIRVHNEDLNSYGFWVLTEGIDTSAFNANPIMLYNHNRSFGGNKDEQLPIGIWQNLKIAGSEITGIPEFDESDTFAVQIKSKYEKKHLRAASIGIQILEWSEDPKYIKPGQRMPTVTKSVLKEISIVDIPSNKAAIQLYDSDGNSITLTDAGFPNTLPLLSKHHPNPSAMTELKKLAGMLSLSDSSSLDDITQGIQALQQGNKDLKDEVSKLKSQLNALNEATAKRLKDEAEAEITAAIADGRLTDTSAGNFRKLFEKDHETAMASLKSLTPGKKLSDFPAGGVQSEGKLTHNGKTFEELEKEDPQALADLRKSNPEAYKRLYAQSRYASK